jgi:hypothetical protein
MKPSINLNFDSSTSQKSRGLSPISTRSAIGRVGRRGKVLLMSSNDRKCDEVCFAYLKIYYGLECTSRLVYSRARDEFDVVVIVQNLKTLALPTVRPLSAPRSECLRKCGYQADGIQRHRGMSHVLCDQNIQFKIVPRARSNPKVDLSAPSVISTFLASASNYASRRFWTSYCTAADRWGERASGRFRIAVKYKVSHRPRPGRAHAGHFSVSGESDQAFCFRATFQDGGKEQLMP